MVEASLPEDPHSLDIDELLRRLDTSEDGLTSSAASERTSQYGLNTIQLARKQHAALRVLLRQLKNALIVILLFATLVSIYLGEIIDGVVIIIIVVLVAMLGFSQEYRTERVLQSLKKMLRHSSRVLREGSVVELDSEFLVPGDVVLLDAGDKVTADMRLIISYDLQTDEAVLTGESFPVRKSLEVLPKHTPVADRLNMVFSGTSIVSGKGKAVVVGTAMATEFGKIVRDVGTENGTKQTEETGFQQRMDEIGKKIGAIVLILAILIVAIILLEQFRIYGTITYDILVEVLLFGVALAVAAIPEALPAIMAGSLAIGAQRMAKNNSLVKSLEVVETLGRTQVICTDKTGTLTKGEMTVTEVFALSSLYQVTGTGYEPRGRLIPVQQGVNTDPQIEGRELSAHYGQELEKFTEALFLCNDASLFKDEDTGRWQIKGDPTEGALIVLGEKISQTSQTSVRESYPRIWEIPFSSESRRMVTVHRSPNRLDLVFVKGALESVLPLCSKEETSAGQISIEESSKIRIVEIAESMAAKGLRVISFASKEIEKATREHELPGAILSNFSFLGLVGISDPPRPEAIKAIAASKKIGIIPVMITGDHKTTAIEIARQMGIFEEGREQFSLTGEELAQMPQPEFERIVDKVRVYARVTPSDKLRIVEAWRKKSVVNENAGGSKSRRIVAMTGDGVNDAPALERADVGIAMGITGTDVAKDASDVILLDDNFATIVKAIEFGRWVQDNVKKYLAYLLSGNLLEVAVMCAGVLLVSLFINRGQTPTLLVPLFAVQLLYINLATDGPPALAVGIGPPDPDIMEKPVGLEAGVFTGSVKGFISSIIVGITPLLVVVFLSGLQSGIDVARTRLFLSFVSIELALALSCRSLTFNINKVKPGALLLSTVIFEYALLALIIEIPSIRGAFGLVLPSALDVIWVAIATLITFAYSEGLKVLWRGIRKE